VVGSEEDLAFGLLLLGLAVLGLRAVPVLPEVRIQLLLLLRFLALENLIQFSRNLI
jgi:hypothetical protein